MAARARTRKAVARRREAEKERMKKAEWTVLARELTGDVTCLFLGNCFVYCDVSSLPSSRTSFRSISHSFFTMPHSHKRCPFEHLRRATNEGMAYRLEASPCSKRAAPPSNVRVGCGLHSAAVPFKAHTVAITAGPSQVS